MARKFTEICEGIVGGVDSFEYKGYTVTIETHAEDDNVKRTYEVTAPDSDEPVHADVSPYGSSNIVKLFIDAWIATGKPPERRGAGALSAEQLRDVLAQAEEDANFDPTSAENAAYSRMWPD